jgi:hypothetical protein
VYGTSTEANFPIGIWRDVSPAVQTASHGLMTIQFRKVIIESPEFQARYQAFRSDFIRQNDTYVVEP